MKYDAVGGLCNMTDIGIRQQAAHQMYTGCYTGSITNHFDLPIQRLVSDLRSDGMAHVVSVTSSTKIINKSRIQSAHMDRHSSN